MRNTMKTVFGLLSIMGAMHLGAAHAATTDEGSRVLTGVYACQDITDNAARLSCYDTAVSGLKAKDQAGEISAIDRQDVEQAERESFGLALPSARKLFNRNSNQQTEEVTEVALKVSSVKTVGRGKLLITMEDGQVWKQTSTDKIRANNVQSAVVKKAALGSYRIKLDGGRAFRAERVE